MRSNLGCGSLSFASRSWTIAQEKEEALETVRLEFALVALFHGCNLWVIIHLWRWSFWGWVPFSWRVNPIQFLAWFPPTFKRYESNQQLVHDKFVKLAMKHELWMVIERAWHESAHLLTDIKLGPLMCFFPFLVWQNLTTYDACVCRTIPLSLPHFPPFFFFIFSPFFFFLLTNLISRGLACFVLPSLWTNGPILVYVVDLRKIEYIPNNRGLSVSWLQKAMI